MYLGFLNLDLLTLGVSIAAIGIFGFVVFIQSPKSATNQAFLFMAILTVLYGSANYVNYQVSDPVTVLWLIRIVLFFAVWHAFSFFFLLFVFPESKITYPFWFKFLLLPFVFITSLLTLTPFVFPYLEKLAPIGQVSTPAIGFAAPVFFLTTFILIIGGIFIFSIKMLKVAAAERKRLLFILIGSTVSYGLILLFNVYFPLVLNNVAFVPFSSLFSLPFILLTAYAVIRYQLIDIKLIGTEVVAFFLSVITLFQIILADTLFDRIFTTGIFVLVLIFSFVLIRGVINEVRQREEIQHLADNLKLANEKLKELDKLKSQFLSIASHDLRAPLTVVRNFISMVLDGTYGKLPPAAEDGLRQVFERATDMVKSVDTYLNVSRIEQGNMKYDFIDVELVPIIKKAAADFKPNADQKNLTMNLAIASELEGKKVHLDVPKINEVLNNLLDNSIKYTLQGSMTVKAEQIGGIARVTVSDTGVGMSQATIGKLFQLFSTGEDSKRVNVNSTGVGLYITKAHVLAHNGRIWAESDGEGKGSRFIVELPLLSS